MSHSCCGGDGGCCSSNKQEEINKEGKLCHICSDKFSVEVITKLTKNPTHICDCCGRVANNSAFLCSPVKLED